MRSRKEGRKNKVSHERLLGLSGRAGEQELDSAFSVGWMGLAWVKQLRRDAEVKLGRNLELPREQRSGEGKKVRVN